MGGGRRRGDFKVKTNNSPGSENGINFRGRRDYWETRFIFIPHFISVLRKKPGDASFVTYTYKVVPCFILAFQFWRTLCDFCFSAIVELNWLFVDRNKIHSGTKICYLGTYQIIRENETLQR